MGTLNSSRTTEGWRDLKVIAFTNCPLGPTDQPTEWASRKLPGPAARVVFAGIEEVGTFRSDWRVWADRLGIGSGPELTVLGAGAERTWNAAGAQFPVVVKFSTCSTRWNMWA